MIEREHELSELAVAAGDATTGVGSVVLVSGEAGIGKSSLVQAVRQLLPAEGRLLVGRCDDLATPRPLGPFRDLISSVGADLSNALLEGDRESVLTALTDELDRARRPTVLAIEDVHWADEATVDVVRFLASRITRLPAVLVLTYRDDELTRDHPLHRVLGYAAPAGRVRRLRLRPLSEDAVRRLGAARTTDARQLFALTGGNPFFVAEVLAAGDGDGTPATVVDAVLTRMRRLRRTTQDALEQLAVIPSRVERWLVESLLPDGLAVLVPAEERGLLVVSPVSVSFRHELARRAIVDTVPVARQVELNRRVMRALVDREVPDFSRIVHHASRAGDLDTIVHYGPLAAGDAATAGAHREAAAHYRLVLQNRDRFSADELARLLEGFAIESYTIGDPEQTIAAQRDAVDLRRSLEEPRALGADLRWLSRMQWWAGDRAAAERAATEAIAVLEPTGDGRLLALALSNESQLHMLAGRLSDCITIGERAVALSRTAGDTAVLSLALSNVGSARWSLGDEAGRPLMEEGLRMALSAGDIEQVCRSYVNIIWNQLDDVRLADAQWYLRAGMRFAEEKDHLSYLSYLHVELARLELARAAWADAVQAVRQVLNDIPYQRCPALTVLGRVRVRRGEPGGDDLLEEAWQLAVRLGELQRTGPVASARAEAAWLAQDRDAVRAIAGPVYEDAHRLGHRALEAELGYWLTCAGRAVPPVDAATPYALQAAGDWRGAAAAWQAAGCPYEAAAARAESPDPTDRLTALADLDALGAAPLARLVRAGLRQLGVNHVPRGPVPATRSNPAGLTERQLEVLRLISAGLANAEIADRLTVSPRTIDSHVSALLGKLGVANRRHAAARARELGILAIKPETIPTGSGVPMTRTVSIGSMLTEIERADGH